MKVLLASAAYPPLTLGGIGTLSHELSLELAKRGNHIIVVTRNQQLKTSIEEGPVNVFRFYSPSIPPKDVWFYLINLGRLTKAIEKANPDMVHDIDSAIGFLPWISKKWKVIKTIHASPQMSEVRAEMCSLGDHLRDIAFRVTHLIPKTLLTTFVKPNVSAYVHVSKFSLMETVNRNRDPKLRERRLAKSRVIYNGVNVDALRRLKKEILHKSELNLQAMTFMGRLMEYKGVIFLLRAFKKVTKEVKDASLHIVGGGPLYLDVKDFIMKEDLAKNVKLYGWLPREGALEILAQSGFLVHPSFYEAFGMVVAESYALGKPVVAHKARYAAEMVEETDAGVTVDVRDVKEFSNALISLLTDRGLYNRLSYNAERAAKERFDIKITARKYESIYKELLERG